MNVKVNISDAKVSANASETLVTYALGSCVGLCLYDPKTRIGGMLHCLLPDSRKDPAKASQNPFAYADSGAKLLLERLLSIGAVKRRLQVTIAGGARRLAGETGIYDIGKQNLIAIRRFLWKSGLLINAEEVGGSSPRTMYLCMADGTVTIRSAGDKRILTA